MKIVFDRTEHVLRSIGDPPNGIVAFMHDDEGPSLTIDPSWEPGEVEGRRGAVTLSLNRDPAKSTGIKVEIDDVVDGLADRVAAHVLIRLMHACIRQSVETHLPEFHYTVIAAAVLYVDDIHRTMAERDFPE